MKPYFTFPRAAVPVEIEAKMKLDDPSPLLALLKERGATLKGQFLEINSFHDTEDRALLAADEGLRIRSSRNLASGEIKCIITHKGPNQYGPLKSREETELVVEGVEPAGRLLECLGFQRCLSFEKRRQTWSFMDCEIAIDEVPHLGCFVEIEGRTEQSVMRAREALKLGDRPLIKTTYVAMLVGYLQENGLSTTADILFPRQEQQAIARAG